MEMLWRLHQCERTLPQVVIDSFSGVYDVSKFIVYGAKETLRRALSRIGERGYDLLCNNCEDFALWCKFRVQLSGQVSRAYEFLKTLVLKMIGSRRYSRYVAV